MLFILTLLLVVAMSQALKRIAGDGLGGRGVTYIPNSVQYKNVVIWLHGLGDTADGWASLMPELRLKNTNAEERNATQKQLKEREK